MIDEREDIAPSIPPLISYKLTFGDSKNLEFTESVKIVESYMHNDDKLITLLYKGLCSFTFSFKT